MRHLILAFCLLALVVVAPLFATETVSACDTLFAVKRCPTPGSYVVADCKTVASFCTLE